MHKVPTSASFRSTSIWRGRDRGVGVCRKWEVVPTNQRVGNGGGRVGLLWSGPGVEGVGRAAIAATAAIAEPRPQNLRLGGDLEVHCQPNAWMVRFAMGARATRKQG
jgi:hypothetical protein